MIEQRIARLRAFLQEHDADGVIIVQPENLRYFSAFTGGEGALVIGLDQAVLWTDSRYTEQAANQSGTWYDIKNHHNALSSSIRSSLNDMEIGVAGYEENFLTHFMYENISDGALCGFLPCDLTSLRAVKEPCELKATRKASNIADRAFADLLPYINLASRKRNWLPAWKAICCFSGRKKSPLRLSSPQAGVRPCLTVRPARKSSKPVILLPSISVLSGKLPFGHHPDCRRRQGVAGPEGFL